MIIGLSGYARSGKDTMAEILCLNYEYKRVAFADPMRDALYKMNPIVIDKIRLADVVDTHGWEIAKTYPEARRLLQRLGTEVGREMFGQNFWVEQALRGATPDSRIVISDVRFPNEADAIKELGGKIVRINRLNTEAVNSHPSEHAMDDYAFDKVINNHTTVDDFADDVFMFAKEYNL